MTREQRARAAQRMQIDDMRRHIERLLAPLVDIQVFWIDRPDRARVLRDLDGSVIEVQIAPIRSGISYATALHEIGHYHGRNQKLHNKEFVSERWAWEWARRNAIVWTPAMERNARTSLAWYERREGLREARMKKARTRRR